MTIILGECDPSGRGPLLPDDEGSAGNRLWRMSGMSRDRWLSSFTFMNLIPERVWSDADAVTMAKTFLIMRGSEPVIALGRKVEMALRRAGSSLLSGIYFIPHPSGRNLVYNSPEKREEVRKLLQRLARKRLKNVNEINGLRDLSTEPPSEPQKPYEKSTEKS